MKKYTILQGIYDYEEYLQLRAKKILPLLIFVPDVNEKGLTEEVKEKLSDLYTLTRPLFNHKGVNGKVFEIETTKILKAFDTGKVVINNFVTKEEKAYRITAIIGGNTNCNSGALALTIKSKVQIHNIDDLTAEVYDSNLQKVK